MKIKCPSCSAVLNIPETAAGKNVKCPCGKQLRAPGGAAKAAAPQQPAAAPAAQPSGAQAAASGAQAAAGGPSGFEAGLFDELTEGDLQGVAPVTQPGVEQKKQSTAGKLLQQYSSDEAETKQKRPKQRRRWSAMFQWFRGRS